MTSYDLQNLKLRCSISLVLLSRISKIILKKAPSFGFQNVVRNRQLKHVVPTMAGWGRKNENLPYCVQYKGLNRFKRLNSMSQSYNSSFKNKTVAPSTKPKMFSNT